ncbi:hypothetical protein ACFE04_025938 [Oxalis oulophora]
MAGYGFVLGCMTLVILCMVVQPSVATVYTVGDDSGWTLGVDYVFDYLSGSHTIEELNKSDFEKCKTGNPIASDHSGKTRVDLKTVGTRYFTCGVLNHCWSGMKLEVIVEAAKGATKTPTIIVDNTTITSLTVNTYDQYSSGTSSSSSYMKKSPYAALMFSFAAFFLLLKAGAVVSFSIFFL